MGELHDLTALEQGAAIRRGEVSTAELVEHYLGRIEEHAEKLGAFVTVTAEQARAATPQGDGPLAGVPTAIKDLNATAGVRTSFGSPVFADFVPDFDDEVVRRIAAAGMVSLGKTSTPEFGSPCYTEPEGAPPAVTPWDPTRMAGGSSGGAASAVSAGLVPVAQGSDGGGSIRIPASCCGIVGLKPTRGRISGAPMYGDPVGLATNGSLARTVRDAAALLDVMAGRAVGDPFWAPAEAASFLAACDRDPGRLRIARFSEPVIADADHRRRVPGGLGVGERAAGVARARGRRHRGADAARRRTRLRDLLGRADRPLVREPAAGEARVAAAPDDVALRARHGRQRAGVRAGDRRAAPGRRAHAGRACRRTTPC